ncbi:short chain dehydrogenase domain-containing protein [Sarocladium implicatum]|nr:short chain dehydrogenase domain-containing protein [Sarocladium implicatum]
MVPVWFITGSSNGLGLLLSLHALKAGHQVISTVRDRTRAADAVAAIESAGGRVVQLDLTESQHSIAEKVHAAEALYGKIDILVNNAGYSLLGPVESFTEPEAQLQIQTNLFGPLWTIQAVLPGMRSRRSGTIVNITSVAGQDGQPTCGMYAASKFALEGLSESLAREVGEFGIAVLVVEPGAFRTNFLGAFVPNEKGVPESYKNTPVDAALKKFGSANGKQPGDPEKAAQVIFETANKQGKEDVLFGKVRRLILGEDAWNRINAKIEDVRENLETGKEVSFSTSFSS